jgi:hypothetical protein
MFEELRYHHNLRRLQRQKRTLRAARDHLIAKARQEKKSRDDIERIYVDAQIDLEEIEEDILRLTNDRLIEEAQTYRVHVPEFDQKSGEWTESETYGRWYLSSSAFARVRGDIRAEKKASWEYWQGRISMVIGLLGALIGVLAYLKK